MYDEAQRDLAVMQRAVARALAGLSPPPSGFESDRIRLARHSLLAKRRRAVAKLLPQTVRELGDSFIRMFEHYADQSHGAPPDGALADAIAFAQSLDSRRLSLAASYEILARHLQKGRRWGRMRTRSQLIIGLRLPLLGLRFVRFPFRVRPPH